MPHNPGVPMATEATLEDLPGVGPATAEKLKETGFDSYQSLAVASPGELSNTADIGESTAADIIQAARKAAEPGQTVTLRFYFGGPDGREIGSQEVRVQMPAVEQTATFTTQFSSSELITGYRYEVVGG